MTEAEAFVASTTYIVSVSLYSPEYRLIGRLERAWKGAATIGDLSMFLITNGRERTDLDQCYLQISWRKDEVVRQSGEIPEHHANDIEERRAAAAPREAGQEGLVNDQGQAERGEG